MAKRVDLSPAAQRSLRKLPEAEVERLYPRLQALGLEPLPHGATKLKGMQDTFRIRVGDYRIIYEVLRSSVRVIAVPHRRDVYR